MNRPKSLQPFIKMCATIGALPTSYLISMTYEEQILWLCNFLEKEVIPVVNNNSEVVKELQEWFENLDVQEEVDNKINEMYESGQLQEIIIQYLEIKGVLGFDTVSSMKEATNVIEGSICKTLGTSTYNDGYGNFYRVRTLTSEDVIDEINIISLTNYETLIAELIPNLYLKDLDDKINENKEDIETNAEEIEKIKQYNNSKLEIFPIYASSNCASGTLVKVNNKNILIDFGIEGNSNAIINFLIGKNATKLDYAIVTHFDIDHTGNVTGLQTIVNSPALDFTECTFIYHQSLNASLTPEIYQTYYNTIDSFIRNEKNLNVITPTVENQELILDDNTKLNFFNCSTLFYNDYYSNFLENNFSLITLLTINEYKVLFTGDSEKLSEDNFASELPYSIDVFQIPHHGLNQTTSDELMKRISNNAIYYLMNSTVTTLNRPYIQQGLYNSIVYSTNESNNISITLENNKLKSSCSGFPITKFNCNSEIKANTDLNTLLFLDNYTCTDPSIISTLINMPRNFGATLYSNQFYIKNIRVSTNAVYQFLFTVSSTISPYMRKTTDGSTFSPWCQVEAIPQFKGSYAPPSLLNINAATWTTIPSTNLSIPKYTADITLGNDGRIIVGNMTNTGAILHISGRVCITNNTANDRLNIALFNNGNEINESRYEHYINVATSSEYSTFTSYSFDFYKVLNANDSLEVKVRNVTHACAIYGVSTVVNFEII